MQRIVARLLRPPLLWDVLGMSGLGLLAVGLWCVSPSLCLIVLGMVLMAYALRSASLTSPRQREHRPRRRERIEYLGTERSIGRDVSLLGPMPDRGKLIDSSDDDDDEGW